jgi:ADP-ribosylglycohydrolase
LLLNHEQGENMTLEQAYLSLQGLSVGDGFGQCFYRLPKEAILHKQLPPYPWRWTDDTHMALSIFEILRQYGYIDQEELAQAFARRYKDDPRRGYAGGAHRLPQQIATGEDWRKASYALFDGGSYGNGGAMRAAPIGGYFAGDPERAAQQADLSAEVTHAHPEGRAGAIAVAAAAAIAAQPGCTGSLAFLHSVLPFVPPGLVSSGIEKALDIPPDAFQQAIKTLGTGDLVSAQDTVPFCLWCAAYHLDDYPAALWFTMAGLGDRDTTCAIVGGIVALSAGQVPEAWVRRRETLPISI